MGKTLYSGLVGALLCLNMCSDKKKSVEQEPPREVQVGVAPDSEKRFFGEYGEYHVIDIVPADPNSLKTPSIFRIRAIDGRAIEDQIVDVRFYGKFQSEESMKVAGFFIPEPAGSPLRDYPDDSIEKNELRKVYFESPTGLAKNGKHFMLDMETPLFYVSDIFVATSVVEPPQLKERFIQSLLEGR